MAKEQQQPPQEEKQPKKKIQDNLTREFNTHAIHQLQLNIPRLEKCLDLLSEEEVWERPNEASNSIGNLILHLCGNIRQWIIASIGGAQDVRNRDEEFSTKGGWTKIELLDEFSFMIQDAEYVIINLNEKDLMRERSVQGYEYSALGGVLHVVEHTSYHMGQIAFWTKVITNTDLRFYGDNDSLNDLNE